jgi:hypothetical protein
MEFGLPRGSLRQFLYVPVESHLTLVITCLYNDVCLILRDCPFQMPD